MTVLISSSVLEPGLSLRVDGLCGGRLGALVFLEIRLRLAIFIFLLGISGF